MDREGARSDYAPAGVSIRNGPVTEDSMDVDEPVTNGNAKRKARNSTSKPVNYNMGGSDSSDEDVPLVCHVRTPCGLEDYHSILHQKSCLEY
jgi:DNA topoisomerase-1